LIHTVTAACRSLPYCDEAAKEARAKLFFMWYSFGPPSVFFMISPGDECSFRVKQKMIFYLGLNLDLITLEPVPENITPSCKLLWSVLLGGTLN